MVMKNSLAGNLHLESEILQKKWEGGTIYQLDRKHQLLILVVSALILFGSGYKLAQLNLGKEEPKVFIEADQSNDNQQKVKKMAVHVVGAVKNPGVYEFPAGSRVVDAVKVAVPLDEARLDVINLAAPLQDGQQVVVFDDQSLQQGNSNVTLGTATRPGGLVNINNADQKELESLPGIGPSLAQRIIDYRQDKGRFLSPEDIKNVSGIGDKKYEQLKDKITTW